MDVLARHKLTQHRLGPRVDTFAAWLYHVRCVAQSPMQLQPFLHSVSSRGPCFGRRTRIAELNLFRCAILLLVTLSFAVRLRAEDPKQLKYTGYVNDFAGVLSPSARDQLTALCAEVDEKAHAQIAVVTIKSLDGQPVEDYAVDLAQGWGVGPKQSNSGILILLAVEDHKYWTTVGYGLEPILPDGKVGGFGREAVPYLRQGNYDAALLLMTRRIADVIAKDRSVTLTPSASLPPPRTSSRDSHGGNYEFLVPLIFLLFFLFIRFLVTRGGSGIHRGGGWWMGPMIGGGMGGGGWGGGFGGGGGGGGFGGFGGGSFGGGGAGGSW